MANKEQKHVCNEFKGVREQEWTYKGRRFTLEVDKCVECGKYFYGYDGWMFDDATCLNDVKARIRAAYADED